MCLICSVKYLQDTTNPLTVITSNDCSQRMFSCLSHSDKLSDLTPLGYDSYLIIISMLMLVTSTEDLIQLLTDSDEGCSLGHLLQLPRSSVGAG